MMNPKSLIERIIVRRTAPDGNVLLYEDTEKKRSYRRIRGGIALPVTGRSPGFAVIVGEEHQKEPNYPDYVIHTLAEIQEADLADLLGPCADLLEKFEAFYGNNTDETSRILLQAWNKSRRQNRERELNMRTAAHVFNGNIRPALEYGVQRIRARTEKAGAKTLIVEDCPETHGGLESNLVSIEDAEGCPSIIALCFAIGAMDHYNYIAPSLSPASPESGEKPLFWRDQRRKR